MASFTHSHGRPFSPATHPVLPLSWEVPPLSLQKKCWNKTSPRVVPKPQGKLFFHLVFKGSTDLLQKKKLIWQLKLFLLVFTNELISSQNLFMKIFQSNFIKKMISITLICKNDWVCSQSNVYWKKKYQTNTTFKLFVKVVFWIHISNPLLKDPIFSSEIIQQKP